MPRLDYQTVLLYCVFSVQLPFCLDNEKIYLMTRLGMPIDCYYSLPGDVVACLWTSIEDIKIFISAANYDQRSKMSQLAYGKEMSAWKIRDQPFYHYVLFGNRGFKFSFLNANEGPWYIIEVKQWLKNDDEINKILDMDLYQCCRANRIYLQNLQLVVLTPHGLERHALPARWGYR